LIDIMPTALDVAGVELPERFRGNPRIPVDGQSLAATFAGEKTAGHDLLFFHHAQGRALRHGDWKIVRERTGPWQLYNLADDPLELTNLAEVMPEKTAQLAVLWNAESARHARQAQQR
jgi:arylsulfatase